VRRRRRRPQGGGVEKRDGGMREITGEEGLLDAYLGWLWRHGQQQPIRQAHICEMYGWQKWLTAGFSADSLMHHSLCITPHEPLAPLWVPWRCRAKATVASTALCLWHAHCWLLRLSVQATSAPA
jgi:hypothetical protein